MQPTHTIDQKAYFVPAVPTMQIVFIFLVLRYLCVSYLEQID